MYSLIRVFVWANSRGEYSEKHSCYFGCQMLPCIRVKMSQLQSCLAPLLTALSALITVMKQHCGVLY